MKHRKENPDKKFINDKRYAETPAGRESKRVSFKKRYRDGTIQIWADQNKDKMKKYAEDRKHKNHLISEEEWYYCKKYFNSSCAYCGLTEEESLQKYKERLHKEHVDHEGSRYLDNCVPACKSCNSQKWKFTLEEWYNVENPNCLGYSEKRLIKIHKWLNEDYKKYIKTVI